MMFVSLLWFVRLLEVSIYNPVSFVLNDKEQWRQTKARHHQHHPTTKETNKHREQRIALPQLRSEYLGWSIGLTEQIVNHQETHKDQKYIDTVCIGPQQ